MGSSEIELRIGSWVEDEMQKMAFTALLVDVRRRDHEAVEVMIQRSAEEPWLRFFVHPYAAEEDARRTIREHLAKGASS